MLLVNMENQQSSTYVPRYYSGFLVAISQQEDQ
jgi:hypothetical protein